MTSSSSNTTTFSNMILVLRLGLLFLLATVAIPCASAWGFGDTYESAASTAHARGGFEEPAGRFKRGTAGSRDSQLILEMVETLLSTVDARFKKLDVLDATHRTLLDRLGRKMDALDQKVGDTGANVAAMLNAMRALDNKLVTLGGGGKTVTDALASRMGDLHTKVDALSKSVTQLKDEVKPKTKSTTGKDGEPLVMQGSERRHIVSSPPDSGKAQLHGVTPAERIEREINVVKGGLRSIESKLQSQTNKIATSIATLMQSMADVRDALIDTPADNIQPSMATPKPLSPNQSSTNGTVTTVIRSVNSSTSTASSTKNSHQSPSKQHPKLSTKFERLFHSLAPLIRVVDQMDHVYGAIISTRRSVDDARSKSEQLLTHSYHTTEALNDVKNDLYLQTNKIMDNLGQVEQWLRDQQTGAASNLDPKFLNAELKELLDRADEESATKDRVSQRLPDIDDELDDERVGGPRRRPKAEGDYGQVMSDIEIIPGRHVITSLRPNATRGPITIVNESYANTCPFQEHPGINCADLKSRGVSQSGVYYILIKGTTYWFMKVYCEMEIAGGGWTVIQRRDEYGEAHESFNRDWNEYKNGFGDLTKEFWLGNENIFMLTNQDEYNLRIDLEDFDGNKRFAEYSKFKLYSEAENYKLEIGGYDGTAGDSLNDPWYGSNLSPFSTYNRDNDRSSLNCASMLRGGWWWRSCGRGLNGLYLTDPNDLAARQGIVWFRWRGWDYTLKKAQMMIRPKEFEPQVPQQSANSNNDSTTTDQESVLREQNSNQDNLPPKNSRQEEAQISKS